MELPSLLLDSLKGVTGFDEKTFEAIHSSGEQVTSIRINPSKIQPDELRSSLPLSEKIPWTEYGYYLTNRPSFTFDPLFHAGCYYVQEASSMFLEEIIRQTTDLSADLKVLDLCAAPGGKSTHLLSLISSQSLLVSNEIIRSRVNILSDNLTRWGSNNVVITSNDPRDFKKLEDYFEIIVIDAPCSGSGLFRRDPVAINEWSLHNVELCCQRQQRILADALPALKEDGLLIYSTCSYSREEDEDIATWLETEFQLDEIRINIESTWNITESEKGYRFFPDKLKGEGFFIVCFRKRKRGANHTNRKASKFHSLSASEEAIIHKWVQPGDLKFFKHEETIYAIPAILNRCCEEIASSLRVINTGVRVGTLMHDKLIPHHMLAMSTQVQATVSFVELNQEHAIRYLQKKELDLPGLEKGWHLVRYEGHNIGWIKALGSRINNYYPKELRILKA